MAVVINSTTGEIDLDQTTPGIYVVTYTVQGVSFTQDVTVNAVDNAKFSYSASSYAPTDADPTPTTTVPNTPNTCLLYTSPSPRDRQKSRMPSSA